MSGRVVQVTNISTQCSKDQIRSLFAHLGRIDEIQLYPESETLTASVGAKVSYIKYDRSEVAQGALQLTNTVFIDRPLICTIVKNGRIPDETEAVKFCAPLNPNITLISGGATWSNTIINRVVGTGATSLIETIDPALTERSLPQYPPLPGTMDPLKAEEIRRTVYVSNISSNVSLENLNDLFSQIGEIRFIRFAGDDNASTKSAYIEFSEQYHIIRALCLNGLLFAGRHLKVNHSTCSIIKPATTKQIFASKDKSPKHSTSRPRRSKSPNSYKSAKKRSSRSPRRRSTSHKRSHSKKRSKSPRKHSSSSKKRSHDHDREKRRRSSSKSKKRSRSRDRKRSKSKDIKKRRSSSKNTDLTTSTSKSLHKISSSKGSISSNDSKNTQNHSRSQEKTDSFDSRKHKSKETSKSSKEKFKDKLSSPSTDKRSNDEDSDEQKKYSNGQPKSISSPKYKEIKSTYGPNPPPGSIKSSQLTNISSSSNDSSSSSNSSSSDEDDNEVQRTSMDIQ